MYSRLRSKDRCRAVDIEGRSASAIGLTLLALLALGCSNDCKAIGCEPRATLDLSHLSVSSVYPISVEFCVDDVCTTTEFDGPVTDQTSVEATGFGAKNGDTVPVKLVVNGRDGSNLISLGASETLGSYAPPGGCVSCPSLSLRFDNEPQAIVALP